MSTFVTHAEVAEIMNRLADFRVEHEEARLRERGDQMSPCEWLVVAMTAHMCAKLWPAGDTRKLIWAMDETYDELVALNRASLGDDAGGE